MSSTENIKEYKCVIVGDGGVGKTTFLERLSGNKFDPRYFATLGVNFHNVDVEYEDNSKKKNKVEFHILDVAGQENFSGYRDNYYEKADCAIIFFDTTNLITFNHVKYWINEISVHTKNILIVGNLIDLKEKVLTKDKVSTELHNIPYVEISCKTGENLDQVMPNMLKVLKLI